MRACRRETFVSGSKRDRSNFRKNVRLRIRPSQEIAFLLQVKRGIKFRSSRYHELGRGPRQLRRRAASDADGLSRATMAQKISSAANAAAAESAVHGFDLDRFAAQLVGRYAVADLSRLQLFEVRRQHVTHLGSRSKPRLRLIFPPRESVMRSISVDIAGLIWRGRGFL